MQLLHRWFDLYNEYSSVQQNSSLHTAVRREYVSVSGIPQPEPAYFNL